MDRGTVFLFDFLGGSSASSSEEHVDEEDGEDDSYEEEDEDEEDEDDEFLFFLFKFSLFFFPEVALTYLKIFSFPFKTSFFINLGGQGHGILFARGLIRLRTLKKET